MTQGEAIKMFCRKCQGLESPKSSLEPIRDCKATWGKNDDKLDSATFPNGCPLWPFRLGRNPNRTARVLDDDQRAALAHRLKTARQARLSA